MRRPQDARRPTRRRRRTPGPPQAGCDDVAMARLLSVNVGRPQPVGRQRGNVVKSAIAKAPVEGSVRMAGVNVEGDDHADRRVHAAPDKAIYAYASEAIAWWSAEWGRKVGAGSCGENLTVEGVDGTSAL